MFRLASAIFLSGFIAIFSMTASVQTVQADTIEKPVSKSNFNTGKKTNVRKIHKRRSVRRSTYKGARSSIIAAVRRHAAAAGISSRVALAVVRQESNFRPNARGSAGEIGLMQLKCSTARGEGYCGSCRGLYKISTNLKYGMRYLRKALRRGSVAYYNAGIGAKRLPARARRYARQVRSRI